jgi:hypothetical protein
LNTTAIENWGFAVEEELKKLIGQQVPLKTKTGGRFLDFVCGINPGVVILATNADGSGRRTVMAIDSIESFTTGGAATESGGGPAKPNWMPEE